LVVSLSARFTTTFRIDPWRPENATANRARPYAIRPNADQGAQQRIVGNSEFALMVDDEVHGNRERHVHTREVSIMDHQWRGVGSPWSRSAPRRDTQKDLARGFQHFVAIKELRKV
jgi:hypothetical protein